jgi:uncharacterized phage protein (TIGR01671 family)
MNREIKFRAWDIELQIWVNNIGMKKDNILTNGTEKRFCVMQYTGLKDKNGKEIYEGDLLTCLNAHDDYQSDVFKVTFEDGCFCLRLLNTDTFATAISLRENISNSLISTDSEPIYNVIGNIFENPELLQP